MPRVGIFPPPDGLLDAVKATSGASSAACGAFSLMRATGLIAVTVAILALIPVLLAQEAVAPYCSDLKRATDLAMTNERFASISAKLQDGDFADTNLALTDWNDCSVYAGRITLATRDQSQRRKKLSKYKERYPTKFSLVLVLHGSKRRTDRHLALSACAMWTSRSR